MFRLINNKGKLKAKRYSTKYVYVQGVAESYTLVWTGDFYLTKEEYPAPKAQQPEGAK